MKICSELSVIVLDGRSAAGTTRCFRCRLPWQGLPHSYARTLRDIKERIGKARLSTVIAANSAAILLYWEIGNVVAARMEAEPWGAKVIDRLAADIRTASPDMSGFSSRNLRYMRSFATTWTSRPILQQLAAKLPWGDHMVLLDALDDQATRCWYGARAIEHGWPPSSGAARELGVPTAAVVGETSSRRRWCHDGRRGLSRCAHDLEPIRRNPTG